jgi:hypothetical protein
MKVKRDTMLMALMKGQRDAMMKPLMKVEFFRKMNHSHPL